MTLPSKCFQFLTLSNYFSILFFHQKYSKKEKNLAYMRGEFYTNYFESIYQGVTLKPLNKSEFEEILNHI